MVLVPTYKKTFFIHFTPSQATFFFNVCKTVKRGPPTKSGQKIFRLACLFIGRFWGNKSTFFGILKQWKITYKIFAYFPYQKFVSQKQCKIITKNLPYFSYQKIAFQKQGKITTKNLPYFSYQKINVWRGGGTKSGQNCFRQIIVYFAYQKNRNILYDVICGK